jgi:hypothetical protein
MILKIVSISRTIFISFFVSFIGAAVLMIIQVSWLNIIGMLLASTGVILFFVSWLMSGILIVFGLSWLAQAWLRGINPFGISDEPWDVLLGAQKFKIYVVSLFISAFALIGAVAFTVQYIKR